MSGRVSILNPLGYSASSCGYCSPPGQRSEEDTSFSTGLQPLHLTCETYQQMIDRGWRRSGTYCYKPDLRRSCCPQYTIKLNALSFNPSKSQRKLVTKWNNFILYGNPEEQKAANKQQAVDTKSEAGPSISTSQQAQQKKQKQKQRKDPNQSIALVESIHAVEATFISEADLSPVHRFEVSLEPSSFTQEKFELYRKYQQDIHHEEEEKQPEAFERFLVTTPLDNPSIEYASTPPDHLPTTYGSYHQMYRLDGELIAIGVIDVLPSCISSVYFMYDKAWEKYSMGKLSALREATLAKEIHDAGVDEMGSLYMGFYIHSCQKMRYKGDYSPSYLADPETYAWYPLDMCIPLLEKNRYVSFANTGHNLSHKDPIPEETPIRLPASELKGIRVLQIVEVQGSATVVPITQSAEWRTPRSKRALSKGIVALGPEISRSVVLAMLYAQS